MKEKKLLKWEDYEKGVFLVSLVGIIFDTKTKKILLGRRENDPYIPKLTWCFPGGRPEYGEDLEKSLERQIKEKIGVRVKNLGAVFARVFKENKKFIIIYYLCEIVGGKEKPSKKFVELKWFKPEEVEKVFTTSIDPRLKEYIIHLK